MPIEVRRYGGLTWAVWFGGALLCVAVYLKGANAVQTLIGQLQDELRRARISEPAITMAFDAEADDIPNGQEEQSSA